MNTICEKCVRTAMAGAIIIGCALGLKEEECQHLQQEVYTFQGCLNSGIVVGDTTTHISS